jgi:NADPH:quinone reductase-like Zn-dependent oxidoreductase
MELARIVVPVGKDVKLFKNGDRVFAFAGFSYP